ncbi:aromatic-ring-hydroxylating dioxygenase subunit beta [Mycobacterium novum]
MDDISLRYELQDLENRYIRTIDDDRLEEWPDFFTDDATYEILPRENVRAGRPAGVVHCFGKGMMRDRIVSLRKANIFEAQTYRHFVSGFEIMSRSNDRIFARSNYLVIRTLSDQTAEVFQVGCYEDEIVRTADGWRYANKRAIFENARVKTLLVIPV